MKKKFLFLFIIGFFFEKIQSQNIDPLKSKNADSQKIWVDSILRSMTIDQKIGQLFMIQVASNKDKKYNHIVSDLIQKYYVGGLIFTKGTPQKQAILTNEYQSISKIPLLIGLDAEWGLNMRLENTYRFPWNMTLAAIKDNNLIEQFGERLAEQCKRLGIHINFAPVVDINVNPDNPIIGNRSFGENKKNVAQKAIAFTKGMQSSGVLACAKHFPGHGDTATDSHKTLPIINFDKQRLDSVELYPYKKLFNTGISSVMIAHLSIPKLESNEKLPASLSKNIVTKLLQKKLGFQGLAITDGLNMKGVADYATSAQINLEAILAGNDILLIPQDIPNSVKVIKKALKDQKLTEERIDYSVRKILRAKYLVGLNKYHPINIHFLKHDLNTPNDKILDRRLVKNSITLLKNKNQTIPIKHLENKKIAYVKLGDSPQTYFVKMLQNYTKVDEVSDDNLYKLIKKLKPYNLVIIGFHKSNQNPWKDYLFKNKQLVWLQEIARKKNIILDIFASPYSLLQIKTFTNIDGLIVSYQNSKMAQELSAQAIFGAIKMSGKLPVSIRKEFSQGYGLVTSPIDRLQYSFPEDVGMSSIRLSKIDKMAATIIQKKMAPGLQILVARHGKVIYNKSFGYHTYDKKIKVENSHIYDVASLTKILASLPLIMKAKENHKLYLDEKLKKFLPSFKNSNKDTITVREILSHYARLKSWIPFYKKTQDSISGENFLELYRSKKSKKYQIKVAKNLYLLTSYKDSIYKYIKDAPQQEKIGYKYSDLGYFLFKKFLEKIYHKPLNILADDFYNSLGANKTTYLPLEKFQMNQIVPTENDTYFRHQLLIGYVHDMGAAMQGGVGGHSGLFTNANDVAKIMQMYLQKGVYGGKRYFKSKTIEVFDKRYYSNKKNRRGLGFDKPQLNPKIKATCGCVSDQSFGHSGFTGTYTWADPKSSIIYVFLSNRVYPTMANEKLVKNNMRTKIQKIIQDSILY